MKRICRTRVVGKRTEFCSSAEGALQAGGGHLSIWDN